MNIKTLIKRIIFPNTYSSDAYVRYLRKKGIIIGENCYIWSPNHTFIDIQKPEFLHIGNSVKITRGVTILNHDYSMSVPRQYFHEHVGGAKRTFIGDNVFIGMNAIILMGSHIGNNCIIGAGTVVSGTIPDNAVVAGNPGKVICSIEAYYQKHKERAYEAAKEYYLAFLNRHNMSPTVEQMGNAFAWLYLPRNAETIEKYRGLFKLSGEKDEDVIEDFLNSTGMFDSYEDFVRSIG
jgi:acetyltransferase-like isoleucine patch superfamily enzyme